MKQINLLLNKYIQLVFSTNRKVFGDIVKHSHGYNFRCNICGDSKYSKTKKRGWILTSKDPWMYWCFNCGECMPAYVWLKQYFYHHYKDYIKETFQFEKNEEKDYKLLKNTKKQKPIHNEELNEFKYFKKITGKGPKCYIARQYCKQRKIPQDVWCNWFVSIGGKYNNRLIIPFYDKNNNIYYFQARSLKYSQNKYLNMNENRDEAIYNFYNVDKSKPIIVVEGIIDSLFIENSIAVLGTNYSDKVQQKIDTLATYYLFDDDKDGRTKSINKIVEKKYVFLWQKFLISKNIPYKDKWDINDLFLYMKKQNKFTFDELKSFFSNQYRDMIWLVRKNDNNKIVKRKLRWR